VVSRLAESVDRALHTRSGNSQHKEIEGIPDLSDEKASIASRGNVKGGAATEAADPGLHLSGKASFGEKQPSWNRRELYPYTVRGVRRALGIEWAGARGRGRGRGRGDGEGNQREKNLKRESGTGV
jgi:hypothetical protein